MRVDIRGSRELQDVARALRGADKELSKQVRTHTKRVAQPEWKEALTRSASTSLERRVIADTAVVSVSNQNVRVQSAGKGRPLRGGLNPKVGYPAVEFGVNSRKTTYSRTSPKGKPHQVTRRTGGGMRRHNSKGYVFYPAARNMIPRILSLWVQTAVRTFAEALEGK